MGSGKPSTAAQDATDLLAGKLGRIVAMYVAGNKAEALVELAGLPEQSALVAMTALNVLSSMAESVYLRSKGYYLPIVGPAEPFTEAPCGN